MVGEEDQCLTTASKDRMVVDRKEGEASSGADGCVPENTVLLVDDDQDVRSTLKDILLRDHYQVIEACSTSEALGSIDDKIDIALIDYRLPDGSGLDLLGRLQSHRPHIPIIIMTGYGTEDIAIKSFRTGATDYVKKPLNFRFLLRTIAGKLGRESSIAENFDEEGEKRPLVPIEELGDYLRDNHGPDMSLEKVSDLCGVSKFKFCRIFKEKFGAGYSLYLNAQRVDHAKELLRKPTLTVGDIAFAAGFGTLSSMERAFREVEGITPREYRKKLGL